jgi:hypothetical protein
VAIVPRSTTANRLLLTLAGLIAFSPAVAFGDILSQSQDAHADTDDVDPNVFVRKRPEYDPPGIRVGSFVFYPSVRTGIAYTDNVFNDRSKAGDFIWEIEPRLAIESNWNRHSLTFFGLVRHYNYFEQQSEDRTDLLLRSDLRLDVSRFTHVALQARYADVHVDRGANDLVGGLEPGEPARPTDRKDAGASLELSQEFNWLHFGAGAAVDVIRYEDTPAVGGGPPIDNQERNRDISSAYVSVGYEFIPKLRTFARLTVNDSDFQQSADSSGFNHDSHGWSADLGLQLLDSQVLTGEIYASYFRQDFDDPAFSPSSGPGFGAKLTWFPTMLTTVTLNASRSVEDTSVTGASSYTATAFELAACHEVLRNVILTARIGVQQQDFQDLNRTDDVTYAGLGARYLLSENLEAGANWQFFKRSSDDPTVEFDTNRVSLSLTGKF